MVQDIRFGGSDDMVMRCTVSQESLSYVLGVAGRAVDNRPVNPILSHVLLRALGGKIHVAGFDSRLCIEVEVDADINIAGEVAVPFRVLMDLVGRLPAGELSISVNNERRLTLKSPTGANYVISVAKATDFPQLPVVTAPPQQLSRTELLKGIKMVLFAVSNDLHQPVLNGVHIKVHHDNLEFVATNGHRLAVAQTQLSVDTPSVTIPSKTLSEVERFLSKSSTDNVELYLTPEQAMFKMNDWKLTTRLLDGVYPNYRAVIPTAFAYEVAVERVPLIQALERLSILANNRSVVIFRFSNDNTLTLTTEASDIGQGTEQLPITIKSFPHDFDLIAFNIKYVLDGLKVMDSSEVRLKLNDSRSAAIFSPADVDQFDYLIMPIQIHNFGIAPQPQAA